MSNKESITAIKSFVADNIAYSADERAAHENRVNLARQLLETTAPQALLGQIVHAFQASRPGFAALVAGAVKDGDALQLGELMLRELDRWQSATAEMLADRRS